MSDSVTALGGAADASGIAEVRELPAIGMMTLRGDLSDATLRAAVRQASGLEVPDVRATRMSSDGLNGVLWMSPDELLLLCPRSDVAHRLAQVTASLGGLHALAVDVSDARAVFALEGGAAREVLAKLAPVDLAPARFSPGEIRRTRLAQVAAAFWMPREDLFHIVCFRSQARYVFDLLRAAARPGSSVGVF